MEIFLKKVIVRSINSKADFLSIISGIAQYSDESQALGFVALTPTYCTAALYVRFGWNDLALIFYCHMTRKLYALAAIAQRFKWNKLQQRGLG
jgi:hypothetical protein